MKKITPCLWFDQNAEEAMNLYTSIFPDAEVLSVSRYGEGTPIPAGTVMTATMRLMDEEFTLLNGGPHFKLSEAFSFVVRCEDQEEVDHYWSRLTADGGQESRCGWLKDKFGVSWQIVPNALMECLSDPDPARASRSMQAMFGMNKIDIAALRAAADGIG